MFLRLMFLDQVVLEQEGILLIVDYDVVDVANLADQDQRLLRLLTLQKVGGYAPFEVLRLADVDNLPAFVEILVHARKFGQDAHRLLEVVEPLVVVRKLVFSLLARLHCGRLSDAYLKSVVNWKLSTSNRPLSPIFRLGITSRLMNAMVMKGEVSVTPHLVRAKFMRLK